MKVFCFWRVVVLLSGGVFVSLSSSAQTQPPFRIGLNFAFVGITNAPISSFVTNLALLGVRATRQMTQADTVWNGVQPAPGAFNFTNTDVIFQNTNGILPIGDLYDPSESGNGLQVPWRACSNSNNPLCGFNFARDGADASNYVTAVVARYVTNTHYWEIGNENNTKTNRPVGLPVDEFAAFLVTNRNWIRAADPQAQIVLPGCLGNYGYPFTNTYAWLGTLLTNLNSLDAPGFDVMNYHDYKSWWVLPYDYAGFRAVLTGFGLTNMPVWITECSSASVAGNPASTVPYASEDQQAADVWRRSSALFGSGATAWFWHSLFSGPTGGFANQGLLTPASATPGGQKKKSWHAFKLLVEKIEGFQSATALSIFTNQTDNTNGGFGQWAVRYDWNDGTRRYVVWSGTNLNYTLTGLDTNAAPYRVTTVVPATISTNGETVTFAVTTNSLAGTSLALTGTNLPVLVESTLSLFQIWANTRIPNAALRGQTDDPDGDGQNNYAEFLAGTDPNVMNSVFKLTGISREGLNWRICWSSASNKIYSVLRGTTLPNFSALQTNLAATPPTNNWLDTNGSGSTLFYRIRLD